MKSKRVHRFGRFNYMTQTSKRRLRFTDCSNIELDTKDGRVHNLLVVELSDPDGKTYYWYHKWIDLLGICNNAVVVEEQNRSRVNGS